MLQFCKKINVLLFHLIFYFSSTSYWLNNLSFINHSSFISYSFLACSASFIHSFVTCSHFEWHARRSFPHTSIKSMYYSFNTHHWTGRALQYVSSKNKIVSGVFYFLFLKPHTSPTVIQKSIFFMEFSA